MNLCAKAGISAAVYSLRTEGASGIGDFGDIAALIDLAGALGVGKVVLQSVVDVTFDGWGSGKGFASGVTFDSDGVPQAPIYPVYINTRPLNKILNKAKAATLAASAAELDTLAEIDYRKVYNVKMHLLRERFWQEGEDVLGSEAYHTFWKANRDWLESYSVYCSLRHNYGTGNSRYMAETDYESLMEDAHFINEYSDDIRLHLYVQFLLHSQLEEAFRYAAKKGITLSVSTETPRNVFFAQWWSDLAPQDRQEYYSQTLGLTGEAPAAPEPWIAEAFIRNKLNNSASEAVMPLEDWLSSTSILPRIPAGSYGDSRPENWHYRMDVPISSIISHSALLECLRRMVADSAK